LYFLLFERVVDLSITLKMTRIRKLVVVRPLRLHDIDVVRISRIFASAPYLRQLTMWIEGAVTVKSLVYFVLS
jgi:hypothetical protein